MSNSGDAKRQSRGSHGLSPAHAGPVYEDNKAFALKEHADFPMLSNPDKKVAFAYQVISPDTPPERQFAKRWTYYIDPTGKIAFVDKAVKPATSGQDIVVKLGELNVPKRK